MRIMRALLFGTYDTSLYPSRDPAQAEHHEHDRCQHRLTSASTGREPADEQQHETGHCR